MKPITPYLGHAQEIVAALKYGYLFQGPKLLDVSVDEYYTAPDAHFTRLYARWLERG